LQAAVTVTPARIPELLLGLATVRPVFIWGAPGIGKSSLVREFAESLGLECVSLLGTQLAPEDLIGVPQIRDGRSVFCPPEAIARDEPYCLFLDELNAATPDVQKAFYSLILDRRIGNYELPKGSIVIGAGNRATDNALARPIASALINRLTHVHLEASPKDWLNWAAPTASTRGSWTTSPTGPTTCGPSRRRPRSPSPRPVPGTCSPTRWAPSGPTSTRTP
jgi:MoxR-like ATPase